MLRTNILSITLLSICVIGAAAIPCPSPNYLGNVYSGTIIITQRKSSPLSMVESSIRYPNTMALHSMEPNHLQFPSWRQKRCRSRILSNWFRTPFRLRKWKNDRCSFTIQKTLQTRSANPTQRLPPRIRNSNRKNWGQYQITFRVPNYLNHIEYFRNRHHNFSNHYYPSQFSLYQLCCIPIKCPCYYRWSLCLWCYCWWNC